MLPKRYTTQLSEVRHDKKKVSKYAVKHWSPSRNLDIGVYIGRQISGGGSQYANSKGTFKATACVKVKGRAVVRTRNGPGRKGTRCAVGMGVSPSRATATALRKLAGKLSK